MRASITLRHAAPSTEPVSFEQAATALGASLDGYCLCNVSEHRTSLFLKNITLEQRLLIAIARPMP
jgi:hypothetical protein